MSRKMPAEMLKLLEELSRAHGMPIVDIAKLARAIAVAEIDPIVATGAPFLFPCQRPRRPSRGDEDIDFWWINPEVPEPNAQVDLLIALDQCQRDFERGQQILDGGVRGKPSIDDMLRVSRNQRDWCWFWSVRHPHPPLREAFRRCAEEREAEMERAKAKANELLRRRGVVVHDGEGHA